MTDPNPPLLRRISLAFRTFFNILADGEFAGRLQRMHEGKPSSQAQPAEPPKAAPRPLKEISPDAALQLLGLLQRHGRFIDFIEEDVTRYSDADIGAAARILHGGCRKVLNEHFTVKSIHEAAEGTRITLNEGFDASATRLTGNVVGKPPFHGSLSHRGWRVTEVRLPKISENHNATVIAPAEVEL